jgi:putative salt-induced outer membrane protein YdiY
LKHYILYILFVAAFVIAGFAGNDAFSLGNGSSSAAMADSQLADSTQSSLAEIRCSESAFQEAGGSECYDDKKMATIEESEKQLKSQQQLNKAQAELIESLRLKNEKLQRKIAVLEQKVDTQSVYIKEHETSLQLAREKMRLLTSESEQVKETINKLPDMMRLKVNPAPQALVEKEAPVEEKPDEEKESKPESGFFLEKVSGAVEFGFKYEQDNAKTKHVEGSLTLDYDEPDKFNINSKFDFEFEDEDNEANTEKYRWQLQGDYHLDPYNLLFVRSDIARSEYASYSKEDVYTLGYGRIVFNANKHKLNFEAGPGYRFTSPNLEEDEDGISIDEFIVRTRINYQRIFSENLQFKIDTSFEIGAENSIYETKLKAQNRIYRSLFLVFDLGYKYTELVPEDMANDEMRTGMKLLYAF